MGKLIGDMAKAGVLLAVERFLSVVGEGESEIRQLHDVPAAG